MEVCVYKARGTKGEGFDSYWTRGVVVVGGGGILLPVPCRQKHFWRNDGCNVKKKKKYVTVACTVLYISKARACVVAHVKTT
jgi:hypothetical protein